MRDTVLEQQPEDEAELVVEVVELVEPIELLDPKESVEPVYPKNSVEHGAVSVGSPTQSLP